MWRNIITNPKTKVTKGFLRKAGNFIFFGLLVLLLLNPSAKSWLLQRFMSVGLFNAEIKKDRLSVNAPVDAAIFSFRDKHGNKKSTAELKGKIVFINFWATWCPPCRAEMPSLNDLYNRFRDDDRFVFLFLSEDNDPAVAERYLQNNGFNMPLLTGEGAVPEEVYSGTLPTTVVLNKKGEIVYKHEGLAKYNTTEFINQLKALL